MPHAASGRLQHLKKDLHTMLVKVSMPHAADGRLQPKPRAGGGICCKRVSMPHAADGRLQQHHVGSPMILDLTGTIWREMQNYSIFSILEHVHKSEI